MKNIFISLAFALLLVLPGIASAATVDELNARLQSLLAQVDQVRQELSAAQAAAKAALPRPVLCVPLTRALALGASDADTNGEVTKLQKALAADASLYPEARVTGYFGPATQAAVKRLQVREKLPGTGTGAVESATRAFLASHCSSVVPSPTGTTTRTSVAESLQSALATITLDTIPNFTLNAATITGSAKNISTLSIEVRSSEVVYSNPSVPVKDGRWSVTTSSLRNGSYQVIAKGGNGGAIAVGFITIDVPAAAASSTPAVPTDTTLKVTASTPASKVTLRVNGSATGTTLRAGAKALVGWSAENVSSCVLASSPSTELAGPVPASESGKMVGPLSKTTVFTLTCIGASGAFVSSSLTANVIL